LLRVGPYIKRENTLGWGISKISSPDNKHASMREVAFNLHLLIVNC